MKRFLGNLRMSKKLMVAPLIAMLFLLLLAAASYKGLSEQKTAIDDLTNVRFKMYRDTSQLARQLTTAHKDIFKLLGFADAGAEDSKIQELSKESLAELEQIKSFVANVTKTAQLLPKEKEFFLSSQKEIEEYDATVKKVIQVSKADVTMAFTMMIPLEERFQTLIKNMKQLLDYEDSLNKESYDRSVDNYRLLMKSFGVLLGVAILLSLFTSFFMARIVTSPVKRAMRVVKMMADGDLTQEIGVTYKDEIGQLVESVDTMREKMAGAVGQSVSMSMSLSEAASRQAASLEEVSSSMEEMAAMTKQNADNSAQANQLMTETEAVIRSADTSMSELTGSMREIAEASNKTQQIIKTIDAIAFQTNLLALNAAVEAARAGEAGAGFAVVADEVRNLAMRAAESAKNTASLTEDIAGKVKMGESLVSRSYDAFQTVTERSSKVVKLLAEVAAASQEQSDGLDQINRAVNDMNTMTQENAASAEELSSIMAMFRTGESGESVDAENEFRPARTVGRISTNGRAFQAEALIPMETD